MNISTVRDPTIVRWACLGFRVLPESSICLTQKICLPSGKKISPTQIFTITVRNSFFWTVTSCVFATKSIGIFLSTKESRTTRSRSRFHNHLERRINSPNASADGTLRTFYASHEIFAWCCSVGVCFWFHLHRSRRERHE